jgi:hypothetical protein
MDHGARTEQTDGWAQQKDTGPDDRDIVAACIARRGMALRGHTDFRPTDDEDYAHPV